MLKKLIYWLLTAIIMAVPAGAAFALPQEQLVYERFGTAYYSIWRGSTWDNGAPGENKTATYDYTPPQELLNQYTLTRVEMATGYSFDPAVYNKAGGWDGYTYEKYKELFLAHTPDNMTCTNGGQDLATGKVTAKWSLTLNPINPVNERRALDIKDPQNRDLVNFIPDKVINDAVEGWLWFLPVHVKWYGVPKAEVPPDLSNNLSVQITDYPDKVTESEQGQVVAKVTNTSGKYLMTDLVWRINGQIVKSFDNFDLMSNAISALDFTMPGDDITIEVEVNPNHNRPPDEVSWDDNKAVCKVKYEPKKALENTANITIVAPDHVKFGNGWQFTVQVTTDIPKPYVRPGRPDPPQPKVKLSVNSPSGSKFINQYTWENGNWGAIINVPPNGFPVEPTWPDITYTAEFGEYTHIETFTFPPSGMADRNMNIVLYADADCTNYEVPYMHASKNVVVDALIPLDPRSVLTQ